MEKLFTFLYLRMEEVNPDGKPKINFTDVVKSLKPAKKHTSSAMINRYVFDVKMRTTTL